MCKSRVKDVKNRAEMLEKISTYPDLRESGHREVGMAGTERRVRRCITHDGRTRHKSSCGTKKNEEFGETQHGDGKCGGSKDERVREERTSGGEMERPRVGELYR